MWMAITATRRLLQTACSRKVALPSVRVFSTSSSSPAAEVSVAAPQPQTQVDHQPTRVPAAARTSWWFRWVYGENPRNPERTQVARLLEKDGIDPLLLDKDELDYFRKLFLTEVRYWVTEEPAEAWKNVITGKRGTGFEKRYREIQIRCGGTFPRP